MGSLKTVKSARILLLGQNSVATEQLQRFLVSESATTEIITAMDFPQGIEILAQEKLDAVLLAPSDHLKDHIESIKNIVILAENAAVVVFTDHYDPHLAPVLALHGVEQYLSMDLVNETSLWPLVLFAIHRKKSTSPKAAMHKHCQVKDFPNLLYISGFGYFEVNLKGNLICFNDFFPHYLKYSENELLGLNYRQFTDLNSAEKLCNIFNQIYITGKPEHSIEFVAVDKKGNRYHLACSCSLIKGHDGKTIGFLGITQEITQKKKAEAALKESEERYRSILEGIEYGYFELDLKGEFTFFNDAMCKISGFTRDKLTGLDSRQYMDEKNVRKLQKIYKEIYTTGKPANNIAYSRQREDGKIIHIESSASLKYDEHNKVVGFRGIAKDVTDRKKTEEKLRQSERRYRNILDSIEDAYYEIDLKGRLTFFNDAMSNLHGYSPDELKLMPHTKYTLEEDRPRLNKIHAHVYKTGKSIKNFQLKTISKNGEIRYLESSISLIKDENGVPIGYRGITRDVTDRKNTELELQKAKEDAEMATRAKSEFLANMSHEIRTPMNGIIGMYNLLLSTNLNIEQLDYVQTGKRSADGLLVIINDILDFSKIEAGKLELDIMDFDLRKAVQESIELPAMQAHQKGLEFIYQIDADIPSDLKGDPGRLKQIITNLCNNALKFTQSGEIVVRATPANETENHVRIRFTVEDTGIGINKENQKKLFRTFHQVDSSTTRKYGGTGLGLAICKKLAELMQGSIGVISDSGAGTTFWFEIPFEKQPHAEKHPLQLPNNIRDKRILVVDDNQTNLDILVGYLNSWGCTCETAKHGEMALTLMRAVAKVNAPFDLVIIDSYMPEMDGAEIGRQIKDDPKLKETPLVMLTAQGVRGDAAKMKNIGFNAYLTKPIRRSQLYDSLALVLGHAAQPERHRDKKNIVTRHTISEVRRKNVRILLAEDNIINRKLALKLLDKFGFQTKTVTNGKEALKALTEKEFDLILMDVQMPELDGLAATKIIRDPTSEVPDHQVPIIAMTAHAMKGDREMCLKAGMDDYISKPIEPDLMFAAIDRQIKRKLNRRQSSEPIS